MGRRYSVVRAKMRSVLVRRMAFRIVGHAAETLGEIKQFAPQFELARRLSQSDDFRGDLPIMRRARLSRLSHPLAVLGFPLR